MTPELAAERGPILLALARGAIARALGLPAPATPEEPWLRDPGACFVTLMLDGDLRGCIGSLEPHRPLGEDVAANARAAALHDPRFAALSPGELEDISVEVSVLGTAHPLVARTEDEAVGRLQPGIDGVILESSGRRATFLPQVWDDLSDPREFLAQLKRKAGLPGSGWPRDVRLWTYPVTKHAEPSKRRRP